MTAGEQMVWAARFAGAVSSGCKPEVAARMATRSVQQLREVDLAKIGDDERHAVEEMRGSAAPRCTGFAASWCPACGTCSCGVESRAVGAYSNMCPLHKDTSLHAVEVCDADP